VTSDKRAVLSTRPNAVRPYTGPRNPSPESRAPRPENCESPLIASDPSSKSWIAQSAALRPGKCPHARGGAGGTAIFDRRNPILPMGVEVKRGDGELCSPQSDQKAETSSCAAATIFSVEGI
jgi:hypothetical protein